jgi:hypothetical protein
MAPSPEFVNNFTVRFAPFINPMAPDTSIRSFLPLVPPKERNGLKLQYPIQAAFSHGQTVTPNGTIGNLNAARSGVDLMAELDATNLYMRDALPYDAMMRGNNGASKDGQSPAYWKPIDKLVKNLQLGMEYYTEIALKYGPGTGATILDDIGVVATTPVAGGSATTYGGGTGPVVQLTAASWAAGMWNLAGDGGNTGSGMLVDILNSAGTAVLETNVRIIGVVDPSLCQVKMIGSTPGSTTVAAGHRILPAGWYQNQAIGLGGILRNTGTFANIPAATNPFWRARGYNAGGALTADKMLIALAKMHAVGVRGGLTGFVHALHFSDLVNQTTSLTRWNAKDDGSTGDVKVFGSEKIEFMSAVGPVTLVNHLYAKQGECEFLPKKECVRVGACDITMKGVDDGRIILEIPNQTGSEIRSMAQQAPLIKVPAHALRVFGITPTGADTSGS